MPAPTPAAEATSTASTTARPSIRCAAGSSCSTPGASTTRRWRPAPRRWSGRHDFRAFTPSETQHVFFERTVTEAAWRREGDKLEFRISADGFLRHMVRVLIGTMLMRPDPDLFARLLEGRPRSDAGRTALPHGLTLLGVKYDD